MGKTKRCGMCGQVKPATLKFFAKRSSAWDKLQFRCKDCAKQNKSQWNVDRKDHVAEYNAQDHSWRYLARLEQLAGRPRPDLCEHCGSDNEGRSMEFDHDHDCCPQPQPKDTCGHCFRAWLCRICNNADVLAAIS